MRIAAVRRRPAAVMSLGTRWSARRWLLTRRDEVAEDAIRGVQYCDHGTAHRVIFDQAGAKQLLRAIVAIGDRDDDDIRIEHANGLHTDQLEREATVRKTLDRAKAGFSGHAKIDGRTGLTRCRATHFVTFDPFELDLGRASAVGRAPEAEVGKAQPLPFAVNRWSVRAALALAVRHVAKGKGLPQGDRRAGITQYESTLRRQPSASPLDAQSYIRRMHSLLIALALALPRILTQSPTDSISAIIRARIAQVPGAEVGLAFRRLDGTDSLYIEADSEFHAASTMKVPVMIELFRQIDHGSLSLDTPILVENQFKSIVDSSTYTLDPGDDSDSAMYKLVGTRVSVRDLMDHMIERSSNLATKTLIARPMRCDSSAPRTRTCFAASKTTRPSSAASTTKFQRAIWRRFYTRSKRIAPRRRRAAP